MVARRHVRARGDGAPRRATLSRRGIRRREARLARARSSRSANAAITPQPSPPPAARSPPGGTRAARRGGDPRPAVLRRCADLGAGRATHPPAFLRPAEAAFWPTTVAARAARSAPGATWGAPGRRAGVAACGAFRPGRSTTRPPRNLRTLRTSHNPNCWSSTTAALAQRNARSPASNTWRRPGGPMQEGSS